MPIKLVTQPPFNSGDLVNVKGLKNEERFCIIGFKVNENKQTIAILKALFNDTYIIEKPISELNSILIKGKL